MSLVWRWCEAAAGWRAPGPFGPKIFDRTGGLTPPARAASSPGLACDLESCGFCGVERAAIPFAWEFADPEVYARALAATGPAYEAIHNAGEAEFHRAAVEQARQQLRDGLPLRAEINVVCYLARKP